MNFEYLEVDCSNEILSIRLNNAEKRNALNKDFMLEISKVFNNDFIQRYFSEARVILLSGNGKSFCAGADLNYMKSVAKFTREENIKDSQILTNTFEAILTCNLPVIGLAHGAVFGGGIGLLASCDICLSLPNTKFCFSEAKLGLAPAVISPIAAARMGYTTVRRLFLTSEIFTEHFALQNGLINDIVTEENMGDKISYYVGNFFNGGGNSLAEIKLMLNSVYELYNSKPANISKLQEIISDLRASEDAQARMTKFLNK